MALLAICEHWHYRGSCGSANAAVHLRWTVRTGDYIGRGIAAANRESRQEQHVAVHDTTRHVFKDTNSTRHVSSICDMRVIVSTHGRMGCPRIRGPSKPVTCMA